MNLILRFQLSHVPIRPGYIDSIFDNFLSQKYDNKELIIILNNNKLDLKSYMNQAKEFSNIRIYQLDETINLGACMNFAIDKSRSDYIAKFDDDDYYSPNFLLQSLKTFENIDCDMVGKRTRYIYFEKSKKLALCHPNFENQYVNFVTGASMVFKRKIFSTIQFSSTLISGTDSKFIKKCVKKGFKIYSTDRFNYITIRHPSNEQHTWKIDESELLKVSKLIAKNVDDYKKYALES